MKHNKLIAALFLAVTLVACQKGDDLKSVKLETTQQKFSYGMGLQIGKMAKQQNIELDLLAYRAGLNDGMSEAEQRITQEELQVAFSEQQKVVAEQQKAKRAEQGSKNVAEGKQFLAENAKKEGVKITESGLQYKVIKEGEGAKAKLSDTVKVHYKGTLINGEEFDSSHKRNKPVEFPLEGVIKGWQEGLQLMNKGAKYELYIPEELAYGAGGAGKIGPNSTLIFEVELLDINPAPAKKQ